MSKDSPRTIDDYFATVYLRRYHPGDPSESEEKIKVVVRIPQEKAKILAGSGRDPKVTISEVYRRVASVATETVGEPNPHWAITILSVVDSNMPSDLPIASIFKDEDGAEGWIM
jgi:hypothetical protein